MQLETSGDLEMEECRISLQRRDVQRRLTSLHHPTSQRHLELFAIIFRIKAKITYEIKGYNVRM